LVVCRSERVGDLRPNRERFLERYCATRDPLRQILALDQLHDQRMQASLPGARRRGPFEPVDSGDVGMIERGQRLRFAFESRGAFGVRSEHLGQHLDGDLAAEGRALASIDRVWRWKCATERLERQALIVDREVQRADDSIRIGPLFAR
jgi:hypothetical protein